MSIFSLGLNWRDALTYQMYQPVVTFQVLPCEQYHIPCYSGIRSHCRHIHLSLTTFSTNYFSSSSHHSVSVCEVSLKFLMRTVRKKVQFEHLFPWVVWGDNSQQRFWQTFQRQAKLRQQREILMECWTRRWTTPNFLLFYWCFPVTNSCLFVKVLLRQQMTGRSCLAFKMQWVWNQCGSMCSFFCLIEHGLSFHLPNIVFLMDTTGIQLNHGQGVADCQIPGLLLQESSDLFNMGLGSTLRNRALDKTQHSGCRRHFYWMQEKDYRALSWRQMPDGKIETSKWKEKSLVLSPVFSPGFIIKCNLLQWRVLWKKQFNVCNIKFANNHCNSNCSLPASTFSLVAFHWVRRNNKTHTP